MLLRRASLSRGAERAGPEAASAGSVRDPFWPFPPPKVARGLGHTGAGKSARQSARGAPPVHILRRVQRSGGTDDRAPAVPGRGSRGGPRRRDHHAARGPTTTRTARIGHERGGVAARGIRGGRGRGRTPARSARSGAGERAGGGRDRGDHVRRAQGPDAPGSVGSRRGAARRRPCDPREPRPERPHPLRGRTARRRRLLLACDRPALGGGRNRLVQRSRRGERGPQPRPAGAVRRRHELRSDRAQAAAAGQTCRGHRLLLRRRHGVAAARVAGAPPGGRCSVLRAVSRRGRSLRLEGGRPGDLRGPGHSGERDPACCRGGAPGGRARVRARHVPGCEPRVLQRHRARGTTRSRRRSRTRACSTGSSASSTRAETRTREGRRPAALLVPTHQSSRQSQRSASGRITPSWFPSWPPSPSTKRKS